MVWSSHQHMFRFSDVLYRVNPDIFQACMEVFSIYPYLVLVLSSWNSIVRSSLVLLHTPKGYMAFETHRKICPLFFPPISLLTVSRLAPLCSSTQYIKLSSRTLVWAHSSKIHFKTDNTRYLVYNYTVTNWGNPPGLVW